MRFRDIGQKILMKTIGGRKEFQKFFELLFLVSVHGQNVGGLGSIKESGEMEVLKNIKKNMVGQDITIFDVGANEGGYSEIVLDIFSDKNLKLYSFEPSKYTFENLNKKLKGRANLFNIGFGNKREKRILFTNEKGSGLTSLYPRELYEYYPGFKTKMDIREEVRLERIDDFCKKRGISKIDFLKIDVEGNELNVLLGAKKMIDRGLIKYIQFEFGCNNYSRSYFKDFFYLLNKKYRIYRIVKNGIYPIKEYRWTNEIFNAINYLAIKK